MTSKTSSKNVLKKTGKIILLIVLGIIAAMQLYPIIWLALFSLKNNNEIFGGNIAGLPQNFLWSNYTFALTNGNVLKYFFNSAFVTAITILIVLILSSMTAYAVTRMNWKLSQTTMNIILLGMMVPIHAALLPLFIVLKNLKLLNTYGGLIVPYVAFGIPMAVLILGSFFRGIPREFEEAAVIDGCGVYRTFFLVILPLIRSALATVAIFTYLSSWNELMFAITFINNANYQTLTVGMMSMIGTFITQWGVVGAGLMIATIPTLIIYFLFSRQVQESMIAGAIKG
jgi:raffinose/stachyose/melibiose transport system permease protein